MIAASFLTKHLLVDYRRGEAHYMKYLTDGDWANNNAGWQWSAGCGCDAQPYFRVFNPVAQGAKFDPDGAYVRRYVPELARLPARFIHQPWRAPQSVRDAAGLRLGRDYPEPIVDHAIGRARFLALATEHLRAPPAD
jgi:deoxyribodipyrimidine photo-lyase